MFEDQFQCEKTQQEKKKYLNMADGVDIDLYSDDIDQNFTQMKVCFNKLFYQY